MAATYNATSPYYGTGTFSTFLDVWTPRSLPKAVDDTIYQIDAVYHRRPNLLAFDLYGDARLWWVFSIRNPNVLKDPIFDFSAGTIIYIPKKSAISAALGV